MSTKARNLRGRPTSSPDETIIHATKRLVAKASRDKLGAQELLDLVGRAISLAEGIVATARVVESPSQEKACCSGCSYCCYLQVDVSVPEVLLLASYLRKILTPGELESLQTSLRALERLVAGKTSFERLFLQVPCPLLKDGNCAAYEVRPLVCRGSNSYSWVACSHDLKHPRGWKAVPHEAAQRDVFSDVLDGLVAGLRREGLESEPLELVVALRIALDQPNAGDRWLAGEPVFKAAVASAE